MNINLGFVFTAQGLRRVRRQVDATAFALSGLGRAVNVVRRDFIAVAANVGIVGSSTVAVRSAFRLLGASFTKASEQSELLRGNMRGLKEAADQFVLTLGEALIAGENGNDVFAVLQGTLDVFTESVHNSEDGIRNMVRSGLFTMIDGLRMANIVLNGTINLINSVKWFFTQLAIGFTYGTELLVMSFHKIDYFFTEMTHNLTSGIQELLLRMGDGLAGLPGIGDGLAAAFAEAAGEFQESSDTTADTLFELEQKMRIAEAGFEETFDGLFGSLNKTRDAWNDVASRTADFENGMRQLRLQLKAGSLEARSAAEEVEGLGRAAEGSTLFAEQFGAALRQLVEELYALQQAQEAARLARLEDAARLKQAEIEIRNKRLEGYRIDAEEFERERARERERIEALIRRRDLISSVSESSISAGQSVVDMIGRQGKAYKVATGTLLVAEGIRQFATGVGYMSTVGLQAQGAALIAASLSTFAQARNLGASGGRGGGGGGGGGGGVAFTQDITFVGSTAGQDTRAIADSIRRATRDGIMQAQGAQ